MANVVITVKLTIPEDVIVDLVMDAVRSGDVDMNTMQWVDVLEVEFT